MYRPEFAYLKPTPPCIEQRCQYSFDGTNTPALVGTLAAGATLDRIPLLMDNDAPFLVRALAIPATGLQVRIQDASDNPLSDQGNQAITTNYEYPALYAQTNGAGVAAVDSDDWGAFFPAGGAILLYVYNPTAAGVNLNTLFINFHGVKRYVNGGCGR